LTVAPKIKRKENRRKRKKKSRKLLINEITTISIKVPIEVPRKCVLPSKVQTTMTQGSKLVGTSVAFSEK